MYLVALGIALADEAKGDDVALGFRALSELWLRVLERADIDLEPAIRADLHNEAISFPVVNREEECKTKGV